MANNDTTTAREGSAPATVNEGSNFVLLNAHRVIAADGVLYITDNGAIYCGTHLGASASYTGRDISGQPIERVSDEIARQWKLDVGVEIECETCGSLSRRAV